jgi:chemotaxis protein CheD
MNVPTAHADETLGFTEHLAHNRYFDRTFAVDAVKVLPGEYYVATTDMVLVTVLGSCVSACIRDRDRGLGGMNHFMLAHAGDFSQTSASARYGGYAMELLINHLLKLGARRDRLEAKVFGGGAVMASLSTSNVGERNASFVLDYLKTERIPILASDLLESHPRKVYFFPHSGRVLVKKIVRLHNDTVVRREQEYADRLREAPVAGDIELFT